MHGALLYVFGWLLGRELKLNEPERAFGRFMKKVFKR